MPDSYIMRKKNKFFKYSALIFLVTIIFIYRNGGHNTKETKVIYQTWAQDCDKHLFVAKPKNHRSSVPLEIYDENYLALLLLPNYEEDYEKLTDKVFEAFKYIYNYYDDYGWYVKADDDTFMFVENLKDFLKDKNPSLPLTYGHILHADEIESGYLQGGAGYVLSNKAFKTLGSKLNNSDTFCLSSGREDIDIARCLRKLSIYASKSMDDNKRERFHAFNLRTILSGDYPPWFYGQYNHPVRKGFDAFSDTTISLHGIQPKNMLKLYNLWKSAKNANRSITFKNLLLQFLSVTQI